MMMTAKEQTALRALPLIESLLLIGFGLSRLQWDPDIDGWRLTFIITSSEEERKRIEKEVLDAVLAKHRRFYDTKDAQRRDYGLRLRFTVRAQPFISARV